MKAISTHFKSLEDNTRLIVKSFFSEYEKTPIRLKVRHEALQQASIVCGDQCS